MRFNKLFLIVLLGGLVACEATVPTLQSGPDAEVSFDGLVKVNNSRLDQAWIRPGIDLSGYDQLMLVGAGIKFRSVRETNRLRYTNSTEFPLDDRQRREIEEAVREVFTEELSNVQGFQIANQPGESTLALTGALIDVVSFVPPDTGARNTYYLSQLGAATLVIELSDSMSGQVLARAVDGRSIDVDFPSPSNSVSNRFELDGELDQWAGVIREAIERLASSPPLAASE